ncbi:MAG: extracellular solute-binding protein [Planctomycetales bacterium]|nr:extracellular solute-binding protein [Planctomycetales bacterium]
MISAKWRRRGRDAGLIVLGLTLLALAFAPSFQRADEVPQGREEVLFWHFWGGEDRQVVEQVVQRFNASQSRYVVRPVAMPGNNLDLKLFLAVTGGDPPDLINLDDPIVADWAHRGALMSLDELASAEELAELDRWLTPAARRLTHYDGRYYGMCNGLDVRALYYDVTALESLGLEPPRTIEQLDELAVRGFQADERGRPIRFGYLPDPRRLWNWGIVFGGDFYDESSQTLTLTDPKVAAALGWMTSYRDRFGARAIAAYRQGDQSLPGKSFPLLSGRYVAVMDGQWRVRDIAAFQAEQRRQGQKATEFGVLPLPRPPQGFDEAGAVNGNVFLVPRGARQSHGAWEFMKYWTGFGGHEQQAARTCVEGGWIPVSRQVSDTRLFQEYLSEQPLFAVFVELSQSDRQRPVPVIPGAPYLKREVEQLAADAMYQPYDESAMQLLELAQPRIQRQLEQARQ